MDNIIDIRKFKELKEKVEKSKSKPKQFASTTDSDWKGLKYKIEETEVKHIIKLLDECIDINTTYIPYYEERNENERNENEIEIFKTIKEKITNRKKDYIAIDMKEVDLLMDRLVIHINSMICANKKNGTRQTKYQKVLEAQYNRLYDLKLNIMSLYNTGILDD